MADANRAAVGTLVMRGKEYLAAIRPDEKLLVLETMFFADEVRNPRKELDRLPGKVKLSPKELNMAGQLIDSMTGPWKPDGLPRHLHRPGQGADQGEEEGQGHHRGRGGAGGHQRHRPDGGAAAAASRTRGPAAPGARSPPPPRRRRARSPHRPRRRSHPRRRPPDARRPPLPGRRRPRGGRRPEGAHRRARTIPHAVTPRPASTAAAATNSGSCGPGPDGTPNVSVPMLSIVARNTAGVTGWMVAWS